MSSELNKKYVYEMAIITMNDQNQYQIRPMHQTDINTVAFIDEITWPSGAWPVEDFVRSLDDPFCNCWILATIETDSEVLGYGLQQSSDGVSRITNLCIHPDRRGRSLGGILLDHMINYARRIYASTVELEVDTSNINAYNLYTNHGFKINRLLKQYYSEGSDAYEMTLVL